VLTRWVLAGVAFPFVWLAFVLVYAAAWVFRAPGYDGFGRWGELQCALRQAHARGVRWLRRVADWDRPLEDPFDDMLDGQVVDGTVTADAVVGGSCASRRVPDSSVRSE
jgi:hypothetical protein